MPRPRVMTEDECRAALLRQIAVYVSYWHKDTVETDTLRKLNGLVFSILVILDGEASDIPGFTVAPAPHEDDEEYHRMNDENWWPTSTNLAGGLHEIWHKFQPTG